MMQVLNKLQLAKRHISGQSDIKQLKVKPIALSIVELCCYAWLEA